MSMFQAAIIPKSVELRFFRRRCNGQPFQTVPLLYQKTIDISQTNFPNLTPNTSTKLFNDWAAALTSVGVTDPTNKTALDKLALQVANDFMSWRSFFYLLVYNGVIAPDLDATIDTLDVCIYDKDVTTSVRTPTYNEDPEELFHADLADIQCTDENNNGNVTSKYPWTEYYGPVPACGGGGAKAIASVAGGVVTGIMLTDPGGGYATDGPPPIVLFSQGDGTGASATASVNPDGTLGSVTLTNPGMSYTTQPIISFWGNGGPQLQMVRYKFLERGGKIISYFDRVDDI